MRKYEVIIERTLRTSFEFEAKNEEEAKRNAYEMYENAQAHPEVLEGGYVEADFALSDAKGVTIIEWG